SAARALRGLGEFAAQELGIAGLQGWDIPYASERLKEARYAFSDEEVRQYFTLPKVLDGLFRIIETLFEVRIVPSTAQAWHESVSFYRIERATPAGGALEGALVGEVFLHLYARPGKRPRAPVDHP